MKTIAISLIILGIFIKGIWVTAAGPIKGQLAVAQLEDSSITYVASQRASAFIHYGSIFLVVSGVLILIRQIKTENKK